MLLLENESDEIQQTLVAGTENDFLEIESVFASHLRQNRLLGRLGLTGEDHTALMPLDQWEKDPLKLPARELIFCPGPLFPMGKVMEMLQKELAIRYKFHYAGSSGIIGSDDSDEAGETLTGSVNFKLSKPAEQNRKRILDVTVALFFLATFPIHFFLVDNPKHFFSNSWNVLKGRATWISYLGLGKQLPVLRKGVLCCNGLPYEINRELNDETRQILDMRYALDYHVWSDLSLLRRGYAYLGTSV
jgi:hypothetical protein